MLATGHDSGVLKVIISRGSGGRGYSAMNCQAATRILSVSAYPAYYSQWRKQGITLTLSPIPLGRNPYLAGLKHLNRLEQVLIRSHLEQTDADEALVLTARDGLRNAVRLICSGVQATLFLRRVWIRPG